MTGETLSEDMVRQIHAAADGELSDAEMAGFRLLCSHNPACKAYYEQIVALRLAMQSASGRHELPPALAERITASLDASMSTKSHLVTTSFRNAVASVFMAAMIGGAVTHLVDMGRSQSGPTIASLIVDDHRRSLLAETPVDVVSSDRHTVKPWFDRRLAVSPPVVDLAQLGFELIGGRAGVIKGETVPMMVYRLREHLITLAAFPVGRVEQPAGTTSISGFNSIGWTENSFVFVATSDLARPDLESFSRAYRAGSASGEAVP